MTKMKFQREYIASLVEEIFNTSEWEIELQLSVAPNSDTWFIILAKWSVKEEYMYYHRRVWANVYVYWVNRSNPQTHSENTQVILVSSIEAMNYLSQLTNDQFYVFKKNSSNVIIRWWYIYENWQRYLVEDLDTSLNVEWKLLFVNTTNYVYVESWELFITNINDLTKYIVAEIDVNNSWLIEDIRLIRLHSLKWSKWDKWDIWLSWTWSWDLVSSANLADLESIEEARDNLQIYSKEIVDTKLSWKIDVSALSANLILFPTNVNSDISWYYKMIKSLNDIDYNDTPVDISTWTIISTEQLVWQLISEDNLIIWNPWLVPITTIWNIKKISWTWIANFYFKLFKRNLAWVEELVWTSNTTTEITNTTYEQFYASLLLNNWEWISTDRIVIKFYSNRIPWWSNPVYNFQFWWLTPVRILIPLNIANVSLENYYLKSEVDWFINTLDYNKVNLIWDQEIDWQITFTESPIIPSPINSTDAANKNYVDNKPLPIIKSTQEIFVAWEKITQSDIDNWYNAMYKSTDWKVYKTDADNINKINFIWFAVTPALINENIKLNISWIHTRIIDSLDIWKDFYLNNIAPDVVQWDINQLLSSWTDWISNMIWYSNTYYEISQSLSLINWTLNTFTVWLKKLWSPNIIVNLEIFSDIIYSTLVATSDNQINSSTLTTSFQDIIFTFGSWLNLTAWTYYAKLNIVSWTLSTSNYLLVKWHNVNVYTWWIQYGLSISWSYTNIIWDLYMKLSFKPAPAAVYWTIWTTPWINTKLIWKWVSTWIYIYKYIKQQFQELIEWANKVYWTTYTSGSALTQQSTNSISFVKVKEIKVKYSWQYTFTFTHSASNTSYLVESRLYKNWIALWTLRSWYMSAWWTAYVENFTIKAWDLIQVYHRTTNISTASRIENFLIQYWITYSNIDETLLN